MYLLVSTLDLAMNLQWSNLNKIIKADTLLLDCGFIFPTLNSKGDKRRLFVFLSYVTSHVQKQSRKTSEDGWKRSQFEAAAVMFFSLS